MEVLLCLTAEPQEAVDELVGKVESDGGRNMVSTLPDAPQMCGRMFEDPGGHIWEAIWMSEEAVKAEDEKK
jgi:predicted lactoylglutathione lyase